MSELVVTSVRTGAELDRVSLVDGKLVYATGDARDILEALRRSRPGLTDERLFELRSDWSNGYITIKPAE